MKQMYLFLIMVLIATTGVAYADDSNCHVSCKQHAQIYLGSNCQYTIQPHDVLHYPPSYCHYNIQVHDAQGNPIGNTVNSSHVGQTLNVKVTQGYWSCWASVVVNGNGHGSGGPVAICDQNTVVTLGSDGTARVYWQTIDDGSYVGCGGSIASIKVRRKHPGWCPHGVIDDTQFRDFVEFCCEDAGRTVMVVLRVTDHYGNYNECYVNVHVQDYSQPSLQCPPDITISCGNPYYYDLHDLTPFGTVRMSQSNRQPIVIHDPYYHPNGRTVGHDGYVSGGGCGGHNLWVYEHVNKQLNCGQGVIYRTFTIEGTHISCTQKITINNPHYNSGHHITWPDDVELQDCGLTNTDPSVTGRPNTPNDDCALYATSYTDEVFTVTDGCFKILRRWAVIDWCTYSPGSGHGSGYGNTGRWEHTQIIKLKSSGLPEIKNCKDTIFCSTDAVGCTGKADLIGVAVDDCTPTDQLRWHWCIDVDNDGRGHIQGQYDLSGSTNDATGYYPYGTHKILWRVEDLCGNYSTCSYLFTVKDCKKPSPVCFSGISTVVMPSSGMIRLNARHFDASSFDNCTPNEHLIFSFSQDTSENTRVFDCNNIGTNEVRVWVTDREGNQQYCTSFLEIRDNDGVCPDTPMMLISGTVSDHYGDGVAGAQVHLNTSLNIANEVETSDDGYFSFGSFAPVDHQAVRIDVERVDDPLNGVSVLDLLLMERHILGITELDESWKRVAADVNGDGEVDSRDLFMTRGVMLDENQTFTVGDAWTFARERDMLLPDIAPTTSFDVSISTNMPQSLDLIAIKLADVNGDADMASSRSITSLLAKDVFVMAEQSYDLALSIDREELTAGLDLILPIDLDLTQITAVKDAQGRELDFTVKAGVMRVLETRKWTAEDDHLITITVLANKTGWISEMIGNATSAAGVVVFDNEVESNLRLAWFDDQTTHAEGVDARLFPNPFADKADVIIKNDKQQQGVIRVMSTTGQVIASRVITSDEYVIRLQLTNDMTAVKGMYIIDVQLGDQHKVMKAVKQ